MSEQWPYPGARWWKFDFHTHTPASKDTRAWQRAIETVDGITPEKWLLKYMEAEIDCLAVTDHNSGAWIDKLKDAYSRMKENRPEGFREIYLFPGVEISVQGGFHLLAIFDDTATTSCIDTLLGKVDYDGTKGDSDGVTRRGAAEVIQAVLDTGGLPIPAHVDENKGLLCLENGSGTKSKLDSNTLRQAFEIPGLFAIEVIDKSIAKPVIYRESRRQWTEILGSDCHSFEGNAVPGSRYTWVKMAKPTLDGLRLALLDGAGISVRRSDDTEPFNPFKTPEHFIESIEIKEAYAMGRGQPAALKFSPYFNAIVGGRGTGKSTVIHALRLAYKREDDLKSFDEKGESRKTFEYFNKVYTANNKEGGLRENTEISLTLRRDGVIHGLHWQKDKHEVTEGEEAQLSQSQSITQQRFPLRIFSQGQIAALAGDSQQALMDLIDEAAGTHEQKKQLENAKNAYFSTRSELRKLESQLKERDSIQLALRDVQRKLLRFEEAHYAEILKTYQRCSRQARESNRQFQQTTEMAGKIQNLAMELLAEDLPDGLFDSTLDKQALDAFSHLSQAIAQARLDLEATVKTFLETVNNIQNDLLNSPWATNVDRSESEYESLKVSLQNQGINDPSDYGKLVQDRERLEMDAKRLDVIQNQVQDLLKISNTQLESIESSRLALSEIRLSFLQTTLAENQYVRINVKQFGAQASDIEKDIRAILKMTDGRFVGDIMDNERNIGVVFEITNATSTYKAESIRMVKDKLIEGCKGTGLLGGDIRNRLKRQADSTPEYCDHILCWFPEDGLDVEYSIKGDGRNFMPIKQASAGQRAAAMLAFLLTHGNEPLVLDQPEDDLDNHLIYNLVVEQIRTNKQRRQLIIVTHNPNIVVNGDAEMIYALDFNNQCFVKDKGSLQERNMREEICRIMEGGEIAFERRYRRLGRKV